jgi:hypothetical protein
MKKNSNLKLVICIMTILMLGLTACQHRGDRRHAELENNEKLAGHIVSELELNGSQEILLNEIIRNLEEAKKELGDREELKQIFVSQLNSEVFDEEYLHRETARVTRELERASDKFITGLGSFHASLNEQQRQKLSNFVGREKGSRNRHN